jgi:phage/plasmid-associated DNA primase
VKLQQLDTHSFTNGHIEWIKNATYVETVEWNNNPNLCVFTDSVYDLETGAFIEASREQFTNATFGYAYSEGGDDAAVQEARAYIEESFLPSILGDAEIVRYVKIVMASFLAQGNKEEKGHFWLGDGRNGKGTLTKLLNAALGDYSGDLNLGFYTSEDTAPDGPNNNLYGVRNARLLLTSEVGMSTKHPDQAQTFALEKFKMMTGGDPMLARQNHENNQVTFAGGSVLIQTNIMPEMMGAHRVENASLRQRIEVVKFPFSFVEDTALIAQEPEKYKPVDSSIKARFEKPEYRKAFIEMLLEYHKIYREEGIVTPASVNEFKRMYFEDADKVKMWLQTTVREHEKVEHRDKYSMGLQSLYQTFRATGNYVTVKQFKDDVAMTLGTRDPKNKEGARGVYICKGYSYLQGYELNADMDED